MELYHYRPMKSALREIEDGTLYFAAREDLNDPIEGYVCVFWQGDRAAWEGLFRNYVCSVHQAIDLYLLRGGENMLRHRTLLIDLHRFDDVPLGGILKDLGDAFLADREIQRLAALYGDRRLKVQEAELRLILHFIHHKALILCLRKDLDRKTIPSKTAKGILNMLERAKGIRYPFEQLEASLPDEAHRAAITKTIGDMLEDLRELQSVQLGLDDDAYLYGQRREDAPAEASQRRDWMSVVADFPKIYTAQLKDMVYPQSYVVCFSGKNDDSVMWGNYADCHRGVCLIYDSEQLKQLELNGRRISLRVKPVVYGGELLERNFFETFGRLTHSQVVTWLTGTEGLSSCYDVFSDEQAWRDQYWEVFDAKTYRKLETWKQEDEYRLALSNTFYDLDTPGSRNLRYDFAALKGVIFGVNTSEYSKKLMMERLRLHAGALTDFKFYQAEYDDQAQRIRIREKSLWKV